MKLEHLVTPEAVEAAGREMFHPKRPHSGDLLSTPWAMLMPETRNTLRAMVAVGLRAAWEHAERQERADVRHAGDHASGG